VAAPDASSGFHVLDDRHPHEIEIVGLDEH
jgi:hypothetical protein